MTKCHVCESTESEVFFKSDAFTWIRCLCCNYLRLDPMPSLEQSKEFQGEDIGNDYIQQMTRKIKSKMRRSRHRVRVIKRRLDINKPVSFLDVGSNIGCMVEAAREYGFNATGIDINKKLVDYAKKLYPLVDFRCAAIEEAGFEPESFDVIYTSEVIEHVPNPNDFLFGISKFLKPGGLLYLTTPEVVHWTKMGDQPEDWQSLGAPDHVLYFSKNNIKQILNKHGFDSIKLLFLLKSGIKLIARKKLLTTA